MLENQTRQLLTRLTPLIATRARQRMTVIVATALIFSVFSAGVDVVLPLWATQQLGLEASQWAQLRSLRMTGTLIGVIFLGAFSDRFGQRLLGALSMFGATVVLLLFSTQTQRAVWIGMPIFGALVSTAFVNLNTLTQQVSDRRQGVANSIYRSVGAAAGIGAPVLATCLLTGWGYPPVFWLFAAFLVASGIVLFLYPGEEIPAPAGDLRAEVVRLWGGYVTACKQRDLMRYIVLSQVWGNVLSGVGAFAAIYFTQHLLMANEAFGRLAALSGALGFVLTAGAALFLDRASLRLLHLGVSVLASICSIILGITHAPVVAALCFVCFGPLCNMLAAPMSMWVSRAAGEGTQTAAFSIHKLVTALLVAITMALLGQLEQRVGMQTIFLGGGVLGLLVALAYLLLAEPPKPGLQATSRAAAPTMPATGTRSAHTSAR